MVAYCTSNFGIQGFTQALAMEMAEHNIRVNAVCPGVIDTSRMDDLGRDETWNKTIKQLIPLNRPGSDEEVGKFFGVSLLARGVLYYRSVAEYRWRRSDVVRG